MYIIPFPYKEMCGPPLLGRNISHCCLGKGNYEYQLITSVKLYDYI